MIRRVIMDRSFFAASNSADGFKNYYGECFARAERLFIVKGGPGTGKSTLMRRVADSAAQKGYDVERYYCSSDKSSLDGVLFFGNERIGLIDGTPPHPYNEKYPGLVEQILDTGRFWDRRVLKNHGEQIRELCEKKTKRYNMAYAYLRACGNLNQVRRAYLTDIQTEKMSRSVSRYLREVESGVHFRSLPALINGIGMNGEVHLDSFERTARKIYLVSGEGASDYLLAVMEEARAKKLFIRVAYHPIYYREIEGIFVEGADIWFVIEDAVPHDIREKYEGKIKIINMSRFLSKSASPASTKEKKYCASLLSMCLGGAKKELNRAAEAHFALEGLYGEAMDFCGLEKYVSDVCESIVQ